MTHRTYDPDNPTAAFSQEQHDALAKLYERSADGATSYAQFASRAVYSYVMDCVMVPWCGMQIGIERDGYTHS
jgi:hypothetical protein